MMLQITRQTHSAFLGLRASIIFGDQASIFGHTSKSMRWLSQEVGK